MSKNKTSGVAEGGAAALNKLETLIMLLRRPEGATLDAMIAATGWQAHSVRGALSGSLKKAKGLTVSSEKTVGVRTYRIVEGQPS